MYSKTASRSQFTDRYLQFGFTGKGDSTLPLPLSVLCGANITNETMVPSKLKNYLDSQKLTFKNTTTVFFPRLPNQN